MKLLLRIFLSFICINYAKSQVKKDSSEIEVKYNYIFVQDTLNKLSSIYEPMVLLTNGKKSIYYSENYKEAVDGFGKKLEDAMKTGNVLDPSSLPRSKVKHNVYKDELNTYISNYLGKNYYTYESPDKLNWKIDNRSISTIGGYKCYKATVEAGGKKFVAWFTYDIPISDGPYKFRGLPGLILKVNEINNYINFELISVNKKTLPIEQKKGITVTKDQYLLKRKEYINDPYQGKVNNPEYRKMVEENKRKYNNSLE
ncbi:GLPGLI family protein [uncultured Chryseobacterium sp.]|uniref:GLPGLI family protein n=1 Tax=uncultured Chryseobacterium sp. TaxID=259322 RepID=UPI0025E6F1A8|nr:GLPGLI family protein [uncultured Chryseobacterium sp.]